MLADGSIDADFIGYVNTMMRYYLHIDPTQLSDQEWAVTYKQLADIRKRELKG